MWASSNKEETNCIRQLINGKFFMKR